MQSPAPNFVPNSAPNLARTAMIKSQLEPNGVIDQALLDAFAAVPREICVPPGLATTAYCDADIPLADGRILIAPMTLGKMLQEAAPQSSDTALIIGGNTGYSALILSMLVENIYMLEDSAAFLASAEKNLAANDTDADVILAEGPLSDGLPRHASYSLIVIDGAVPHIPGHILAQLADNGRLVGIEGHKAVLYQKSQSGAYARRILFDVQTKFLPGGWKAEKFAL